MWKLQHLRPLPMPMREVIAVGSKNDGDSPLLIFKFSDRSEMKKFFEIWKEYDLGELVKSSSSGDMKYSDGKKKEKKDTRWSKWGLQNLDKKDSEKPSLI